METSSTGPPPPPGAATVSFGEAFRFWLKLGFISFGGPAGQIAIMHRELVEKRRWISEERFLHALNYCMLLPGPEAQQLATYVGWLLHKVRGGLVAGGLFVLPSAFLLLGLSWAYAAHGETTAVAGAMWGFRPVVVAIVVEAVLRVGRRAIRRRAHLAIAAVAFAAIYFFAVPFPLIVVGAALLGWAGARALPRYFDVATTTPERKPGEATAVVDDAAPAAPHTLPSLRRFLLTAAIGVALWLGGGLLVVGWRGAESLHAHEYGFFTQAALVTFGGAYSVLAYVSQTVVESFGWLTHAQTVDALALAETTPGPLIMVVQFVGFLAAWTHPEGMTPLAAGVTGAAVTTFVTFLPCFLFIFLGAPYIETLRARRGLDSALRGVTAAVVGVILNLALVFGAAVLVPQSDRFAIDLGALTLAVVAFVALWRFKVDVVWVVIAGGMIGAFRAFFL